MITISDEIQVHRFRQILLWPLQLMPIEGAEDAPYWQVLEQAPGLAGWHRVANEFEAERSPFEERHYKEFVVFLPYVQRFLYGEGRGSVSGDDNISESTRRVYCRQDIARLRLILRAGDDPLELEVDHIHLWLFDDLDVAFLKVEIHGQELPLSRVLDLLYRFGRAYPTGWNECGQGVHNALSAEWLAADGRVLASSDTGEREKYIDFARQHRAALIAAHWAFLLRPLVLDPSEEPGPLRYRQIEYHRMPLMAYLAVDDARRIPREMWLRLGLVTSLHPDESIPQHDADVVEFEARYCFDRYWADTPKGPNTRFLCNGQAMILVGEARESYFLNIERGILSQFRHQYFILFLIAHLHRTVLMVFSDQLVDAIHGLDVRHADSVRAFRLRIHACFESFLRFTHRYWFSELSERRHMQALYRLCGGHLDNERLYAEVKEELGEMSRYLDTDLQRRQNRTVIRLTVVTAFSIIGTFATGFLGMNIFALAEQPTLARLGYFLLVVLGAASLLLLTLLQSQTLSDLMDTLADSQLPLRKRLLSLLGRHPYAKARKRRNKARRPFLGLLP